MEKSEEERESVGVIEGKLDQVNIRLTGRLIDRPKALGLLLLTGMLFPALGGEARDQTPIQTQAQSLSQFQTQIQGREKNNPSGVYPGFWKLKLPTLLGDTVDFKSLRGKYVLLNFWGEWCGTCIEEIPFLIKLNDRYGKDKLRIVGLIKSEDPDRARKLIRKNQLAWPQIPLPEEVERQFAIRKFPTNLLISPEGEIVMYGFSHHFQDFKKRMGDTVSMVLKNGSSGDRVGDFGPKSHL